MKTLIVGGGKVGYFLAKTFQNKKIAVVLIEKDDKRAQKISEELNIDVYLGDGSDPKVLYEANANDADIIAAVTGSDEENLVICQIAKLLYPKHKTIARINNPKNIEMFRSLGVDQTVCSTKVIADLIEYEMEDSSFKVIQTIEKGNMLLAEIYINSNSHWINKEVKDLVLPKDLILISVIRGNEVIYPKGYTKICESDHVMIVISPNEIDLLRKTL